MINFERQNSIENSDTESIYKTRDSITNQNNNELDTPTEKCITERNYILCCFNLFLFLIATGLLNSVSGEECGITLHTFKNITDVRVGMVYNFSVEEIIKNNITNFIFNNYLTLNLSDNFQNEIKITNDKCFLTVYNGPVYNESLNSLLRINSTVITNYAPKIKQCFTNKQIISCYSELLSTTVAFVCLIFAVLSTFYYCLLFLRNLIVK